MLFEYIVLGAGGGIQHAGVDGKGGGQSEQTESSPRPVERRKYHITKSDALIDRQTEYSISVYFVLVLRILFSFS